ncbi:ArsB/NhaD family transporter [Solibacillus palustris]|uniref:ArsB/NhaD family transporter n=1 Tax=Solibacillus palustris TaxID=2908203 RepID=UPI0038CD51C9
MNSCCILTHIGALLTPIGTIATLFRMFILKKHGILITLGNYLKVTILVIPRLNCKLI